MFSSWPPHCQSWKAKQENPLMFIFNFIQSKNRVQLGMVLTLNFVNEILREATQMEAIENNFNEVLYMAVLG